MNNCWLIAVMLTKVIINTWKQLDRMDLERLPNFEEELAKLEEAIKNVEENYGDTEVREAIMNKADFFLKNGEDDRAVKTYMQAYEKTVGVSKRLEIYMILLQVFFRKNNLEEIRTHIAKSKALLEEGGDWENKNKLKVRTNKFRSTRAYTSLSPETSSSAPSYSSMP